MNFSGFQINSCNDCPARNWRRASLSQCEEVFCCGFGGFDVYQEGGIHPDCPIQKILESPETEQRVKNESFDRLRRTLAKDYNNLCDTLDDFIHDPEDMSKLEDNMLHIRGLLVELMFTCNEKANINSLDDIEIKLFNDIDT